MVSLGPIGFAAPLVLTALIALPLLWLLLRATPPAPRHVVFAPLRLLQHLAQTPQTPQSAPWWLIALRLLTAAIIVLALAQPVWRPADTRAGDAPCCWSSIMAGRARPAGRGRLRRRVPGWKLPMPTAVRRRCC